MRFFKALTAVTEAKTIVDGWTVDESGHVHVRKDAIQKAVDAALNAFEVPTGPNAYQKRVIDEHAQVVERLERLKQFIAENPTYKTLPEDEQARLQKQADTMHDYAAILEERIAHFREV